MIRGLCLVATVAFIGLLGASGVRAQATDPKVADVMVLGVFHFHNPNADYAKFHGTDVLTPARQAEIDAVVRKLQAFTPTRIAIEREPAETDSINAEYQRYRAGRFTLGRNEIHQLGFRLADRLGHPRLYPIDVQIGMRFDSLMGYARDHDPAFLVRFDSMIQYAVRTMDSLQQSATIGANLRYMNQPENLARAQHTYVEAAVVGAEDGGVGARVIADWYRRNLHMFAHLANVARPGERVLLIVGMGHAPILRDLVRDHPRMKLVDPLEYLP